MRLESLDRHDPRSAHVELAELADLVRNEGYAVEIAALDAAVRVRLAKSAGNVVIDVLQVVLDESERHLVDAVIGAVISWAVHRRFFAGRDRAVPQLVVWVEREIVRVVPLPTQRFDILVRVTGLGADVVSRLVETINRSLPDGDLIVLQVVGTVPGTPTLFTGSATIDAAGQEDAVRRLVATFELAGMTLVRRRTTPGGGVPDLHFEPVGMA
jgi:hypothetical protein